MSLEKGSKLLLLDLKTLRAGGGSATANDVGRNVVSVGGRCSSDAGELDLLRVVEEWDVICRDILKPFFGLDAEATGVAKKSGLGDSEIRRLMAGGESGVVEFKSSARWDYRRGEKSKVIEEAVVKSVAAFSNTHGGGTLLVGVDDSGRALGLAADFACIQRADADGFLNWLTTLFETSLGKPALSGIQADINFLDGFDVCWVRVRRSTKPVYVRKGDDRVFYARFNNSTRSLNLEDAVSYILDNWSAPRGEME